MGRIRPLLIAGTRPEAIKMAPVIRQCRKRHQVEPIVCLTGQHREMLAQVAEYFEIRPDLNLEVMESNQSLAGLTARCLEGIDAAIVQYGVDCVVAQGDTTTVLASSLAAFYRQVPFVHVEAGLRTGNLQSPWPEEFNRRSASLTAALHCAPTTMAANALLAEGVNAATVSVTGNTVVDALQWTVQRERSRGDHWQARYPFLRDQQLVLITGHRRENFGEKLAALCRGISRLAARFYDVAFVYPVHLNPNVAGPVRQILGGAENIHLVDPACYPEFVWLMDRATLILTDSGGVQEEAPSLGKPVLVTRDTTERPEAVTAGAAELVGTSEERIIEAVTTLLTDPAECEKRHIAENPYGEGQSVRRIVDLIESQAWLCTEPVRRVG